MTGLRFEEAIKINQVGLDVSKHKMYTFLKEQGINWKNLISKKLLPDAAFWNPVTQELSVYEKKFQSVAGSTDEKPPTCAFKILQFKKIGRAIGAKKVTYTYIFNNWFSKPEYKDMLEYIQSVEGCNYIIME